MKLHHLFVVTLLPGPLAASAHEYDAGNLHIDHPGKMPHVQEVDVSAGSNAVFAPMGYHVMPFGPKQALREGDRFPLTLHFEKAGDVKVAVQKNAPEQHEHMHAH
jgi:copper(I)-binding protein